MAAGTARAACKLYAQRPGVRLYLYYSPAHNGDWGHIAVAWDGDPIADGYLLATPEPIPCNRDSVSMAAWIRDAGNLNRLPLCGD